jgi:hypothetical protein
LLEAGVLTSGSRTRAISSVFSRRSVVTWFSILLSPFSCPRVACFRIVGGFPPLHGGLVGQDGERSVAHGQPLGGLFGLLDGPLIKDAGAVSQSTRARTGFLDPRLLAWSSPLGGNLWGVINGIPLCGQGPRGGIQRGDAVIGRASGPGG